MTPEEQEKYEALENECTFLTRRLVDLHDVIDKLKRTNSACWCTPLENGAHSTLCDTIQILQER
jgi:hypothetical protein